MVVPLYGTRSVVGSGVFGGFVERVMLYFLAILSI